MSRSWLRAIFGLGPLGGLPARGTWGSLVGLALAWLLPYELGVLLTVVFSLVGLVVCGAVVREFESADPQWFIWDETCGMMLAALWAPKTPAYYLAAFVLFRFLDIVKPWPVWAFEKHTGPGGILWDDLAAGALTAAALYWGCPAIHALATQAHILQPAS